MQTPVSIKLWKRGTIVETLNYSCLIHVYYGSFTQEIKKIPMLFDTHNLGS